MQVNENFQETDDTSQMKSCGGCYPSYLAFI